MTLFYFHLRKGRELIADLDGTELPDLAAAIQEARSSARELLAQAIRIGQDQVPDAVVIADEANRPLYTLPLERVLPKSLRK